MHHYKLSYFLPYTGPGRGHVPDPVPVHGADGIRQRSGAVRPAQPPGDD